MEGLNSYKMNLKYNLIIFLLGMVTLTGCTNNEDSKPKRLKQQYSTKFLIGVAISRNQIIGEDTLDLDVVKKHFSSIVAENSMKPERLQPIEGEFTFSVADKFVNFGTKNNMHIHGHTLVWHSQIPSWFFKDSVGNDVERDVLIQRMKNHIQTVVGHYKGQVHSWDVVNEAISDGGGLRKSKFYEIIGEDYLKLAFEFAHEADPDAELYYNDYLLTNPRKRDDAVKMVSKLLSQGVKIDGIGMQGHYSLTNPTINEFEESIKAFANLGVQVMITELDVSVLPLPKKDFGADISNKLELVKDMDPYKKGLPDSVQTIFENRYVDLFKIMLKHSDVISRVTFWGVNDGQSWKNDWPVHGRTDYPLLIDRQNNPKNALRLIMDLPENLN